METTRHTGYTLTTAQMYDLFASADQSRRHANFFLHYALRAGAAVEIGAGTGRLALPIAERGVPIVCVEPAAAMRTALLIKVAQRAQLLPFVTVLDADAVSFTLDAPAPFIFLCGMFHNLLDDTERLALFQNVARQLTDDGLFVCSVNVGQSNVVPLHQLAETQVGAYTYRMSMEIQISTPPRYELRFVYDIRDGDICLDTHEVWSNACDVTYDAVLTLLAQSGLQIHAVFADYDWTPFDPTRHDQALLVLQRRH